MSKIFGSKGIGKIYHTGYNDELIDDVYNKLHQQETNNNNINIQINNNINDNTNNINLSIPTPPPPPILKTKQLDLNVKCRDIRSYTHIKDDTYHIPRSPILRQSTDISTEALVQSVRFRKLELERYSHENSVSPLFFAYTDFANAPELHNEEDNESMFCNTPQRLISESSDDIIQDTDKLSSFSFPEFSPSNIDDNSITSNNEHISYTNEIELPNPIITSSGEIPNCFQLPEGTEDVVKLYDSKELVNDNNKTSTIQSAYNNDITLQSTNNEQSNLQINNTSNFNSFNFDNNITTPNIIQSAYNNDVTLQSSNNNEQSNLPLNNTSNFNSFTFNNNTATPNIVNSAYNNDITLESSNFQINNKQISTESLSFENMQINSVNTPIIESAYGNDVTLESNIFQYNPLIENNNISNNTSNNNILLENTFSDTDFTFDTDDNNKEHNLDKSGSYKGINETFDFINTSNGLNHVSPEYQCFEEQLEKIHDLHLLKQMLLNVANGSDKICIKKLTSELAQEKTLLNPHHRDWNKEYQILLESPDSVGKFKNLAHLAHDFVYAATTFAKIIISEQCLPNSRKSIPPVSVGGVAGGQKYICQNIIFKFALDVEVCPGLYMYGGQCIDHESAMKAAAHELKGLCQYYSTLIPGLSYPLLANIDYKGFRMIAESVLPIGKQSLCYGSSDSGLSVLSKDNYLNNLMIETSKILNLKSHISGINKETTSIICSCGDLEVHKGTDGRYYVIDFARSFPAEAPPLERNQRNPRAVYYQLLRPELVRSNPIPLSPDAFTSWQSQDPECRNYNLNVLKATLYLLKDIIPAFAKRMDDKYEEIQDKLITEIHRVGINVRHLGQIRANTTSHACRELLLIEMIVRIVKNQLRDRMRATMRQIKGLSQEPFKQVVIQTFNLVLGRNEKISKEFWISIHYNLKKKFWNGITKTSGLNEFEERNYKFICIENMISMKRLFKRLIELLGIRITDQAIQQLDDDPSSFEFVDADIIEVYAQPRFMDIIDYAEAMALEKVAKDKTFEREKIRLLELSAIKFSQALHSTPANYLALYHWGEVLFQQAKYTNNIHEKKYLLIEASLKLSSALKMEPKFKFALLHASEINLTLAMIDKVDSLKYFKISSLLFIRAIKEETKYLSVFLKYLDDILKPPIQSFQLYGLILLCRKVVKEFPLVLHIFDVWKDAIISLIVHYNTLKRQQLKKIAYQYSNICMKSIQNDFNNISIPFFTKVIDSLTEIAFSHKILYIFVAELYKAIHLGNNINITKSYLQWGLALWEYSKTVDYLEYNSIIESAADKIEMALEIDNTCIDNIIKTNIISMKTLTNKKKILYNINIQEGEENYYGNHNFIQWIDLISSTKYFKEKFLSFLKSKTFLYFNWFNISNQGAQILSEYLSQSLNELSFIHTYNINSILPIFSLSCKNLKTISLNLCKNITSNDILNLCKNCILLENIHLIDCSGCSSEVIIWISQLINLKSLTIKGIKWLKGTAKFLCARRLTLEYLDFSHTNISDNELSYLYTLKNLKVLNLNCCSQLRENIPEMISNINSLEKITVARAFRDTDNIIRGILKQKHINIKKIDVSHCKRLTDKGLEYISNILSQSQALQSINLSNCCRITEGGIQQMIKCSNISYIQSLNLSFNVHLQESIFSCLFSVLNIKILRKLYLGRCKITSNTLKHLILSSKQNKLKNKSLILEELSIPFTSIDDLEWFFKYTPNLKKLDIRECPINDISIYSLSTYCKNITYINFSKCNGLKEETIINFIKNASQLQTLKISNCVSITCKTIITICDYSNKLQVLDLSYNIQIVDNDIIHLQNLSSLHTLILSGCIRVKSNSLIHLLQSNPNLRKLNIDNTKLIDNKGAVEIAKYAKNLHEFSARDSNISRTAFDWIKKYRPSISIFVDVNADVVSELTGHRQFLSGKLRIHLGETQANWQLRKF